MSEFKSIVEMVNIICQDGVKIFFEDRERLGFDTYGTPNHAEIMEYMNSADNMLWDAQVFGYKKQFSFEKKYKTKKVLGVIWIPNGNHKIILKLMNRGFSQKRFYEQLQTYIFNYSKKSGFENIRFISAD